MRFPCPKATTSSANPPATTRENGTCLPRERYLFAVRTVLVCRENGTCCSRERVASGLRGACHVPGVDRGRLWTSLGSGPRPAGTRRLLRPPAGAAAMPPARTWRRDAYMVVFMGTLLCKRKTELPCSVLIDCHVKRLTPRTEYEVAGISSSALSDLLAGIWPRTAPAWAKAHQCGTPQGVLAFCA